MKISFEDCDKQIIKTVIAVIESFGFTNNAGRNNDGVAEFTFDEKSNEEV